MPGSPVLTNKIPLAIWERIEIVVERNGKRGIYLTRVEDIRGESIIASKPSFISGIDLLTSRSNVFVQFKKTDALYQARARLTAVRDEVISYVEIKNFGPIQRVQRREFVRIKKRYNIKYQIVVRQKKAINELAWYDSETRDISAGGVLMSINNRVVIDDVLLLRMRGYQMMGIPRLICAVCRRLVKINKKSYAGVEFLIDKKLSAYIPKRIFSKLPSQVKRFSAKAQNKLVNHIFLLQIQDRQKGLL